MGTVTPADALAAAQCELLEARAAAAARDELRRAETHIRVLEAALSAAAQRRPA